MRSTLKTLTALNSFLQRKGFSLTHVTNKQRFCEFIRLLAPIEIEKHKLSLGGEWPGCYTIPDDLEGIRSCISPGVGDTVAFELDLFEKYKIPSILIDSTVICPPNLPKSFIYLSKLVAPASSQELNNISLPEIIEISDAKFDNGDCILSIDIEGDEIDIFKYLSPTHLNRFRIIVVEFHYLDLWADNEYFDKYVWPVFNKLFESFELVHIHDTNASYGGPKIHNFSFPAALEMTFWRKDRIRI
jgi:hypothetical protein